MRVVLFYRHIFKFFGFSITEKDFYRWYKTKIFYCEASFNKDDFNTLIIEIKALFTKGCPFLNAKI